MKFGATKRITKPATAATAVLRHQQSITRHKPSGADTCRFWNRTCGICLLSLCAAALLPALATAAAEQAKKADDFVESIGVNAHLEYGTYVSGTKFQDIIKPRLAQLGVRHLRTGIHPDGQVVKYNNDLHASLGIRFTALLQCWGAHNWESDAQIRAFLDQTPDSTIAVEGPNEPNGKWFWDFYGYSATTWIPDTKTQQMRLYNLIKSTPAYAARISVVGPSLILSYRGDWEAIGNLEDRVDLGNSHMYQWNKVPSDAMDWWHIPNLASAYPSKPTVMTEAGYPDLWMRSRCGPYAADRYVPRILLENWRFGIVRTFLYELYDQGTSTTDEEQRFGLLNNDGSPKPRFTTIKNMILLLQEKNAPTFTPGTLNFSLACGDASVHHFLLQKSDGTYYLAIWQDAVDSDYPSGKKRIAVANQKVTLTLNATIRQAQVFLPMTKGTTAENSYVNPSAITLAVPDHPMIVALRPKTLGTK